MADSIHLVVATPCFGGNVSACYMDSILGMQQACARNNIEVSFRLIAGDSLITRARNVAVQQFLSIPTATHLLFIDADIGFLPEQVFALLAGDKDVCGAIYPVKNFNWERVYSHVASGVSDIQSSILDYVFALKENLPIKTDGNLFRVRYLGTGFMMIKRSVFPKMAAHYPETRFQKTHLALNTNDSNEEANAFFDCVIDHESGTYLSEDYTFCKRWLDMGGDIWASIDSRLNHIGFHVFEGNLVAALQAIGLLDKNFTRNE